ncbi:MAG TPA: hypothetical protein VMV97_06245 [Sulfuriferula sp.]|nr:hypothetical protein [Sulfuriferula sp.]
MKKIDHLCRNHSRFAGARFPAYVMTELEAKQLATVAFQGNTVDLTQLLFGSGFFKRRFMILAILYSLGALMFFSTSAYSLDGVYKCKESHNRIVYSQTPCNGNSEKIKLYDNSADYSSERNNGVAHSKGYKELLDYCNTVMDKAMSSVSEGNPDNWSYRLGAMAPMMQAACGQNNGSLQGYKEKRDYCIAVTARVNKIVNEGIPDNRSYRLRVMAPVMQAACGQNSASAMPRPDIQTPAARPSVITNCDPGGCWDNLGNRYNKGAGNTYFSPSGACQEGVRIFV